MSQSSNVIITSGSGNQIIRVPVVTSTTRSSTPVETVTTNANSNENDLPINNNHLNNRSNDDNCEIKTIYYNSDGDNYSREHLLLPTDSVVIKQEQNDEAFEGVYGFDGETNFDEEGIASKAQFVCKGCGKGFCYIGWLDRHQLASPSCVINDSNEVIEPIVNNNKNNTFVNSNENVYPNKIKVASNSDRNRPSLEGRLSEPVYCPNDSCGFSTYWVQSLNKHITSSCKFGRSLESGNTPDISNSNMVSSSNKSLTCHICTTAFTDIEDHIQHMKDAHQMRHYYKCSQCSQSFSTKNQIETHIDDHNKTNRLSKYSATGRLIYKSMGSGLLSTNDKSFNTKIEQIYDSNEVNGNVQNQGWRCNCGKTYLSLLSFEIHSVSCEKASKSSLNSARATKLDNINAIINDTNDINNNNNNDNSVLFDVNRRKTITFTHFKREQLEAIHINDFRCKFCKKEFSAAANLSNHLSRRPDCREWYYTNLPLILKSNPEFKMNERKHFIKRARFQTNTDDSDIDSPNRQQNRLTLIGKHITNSNKFQKLNNSSEEFGSKSSVFCMNCNKEFCGKNPNVALTNHLRGSTCTGSANNRSANNSSVSKYLNSRQLSQTPNSSQVVGSPTHSESRYYCKLCPRKELKNRISLGCHLTIYHGLPQVNVSTSEGDAYRCQTCMQVFSSKYFYNLHRHECDLTSPYVGVISTNYDSTHRSKPQSSNDLKSKLSNNVVKLNDSNWSKQMICSLCKKPGFGNANAIKIHQKYQCVKRFQVFNNSNVSHNNFKRFNIPSKAKTYSLYGNKRKQRSNIVSDRSKNHWSELAKLNDMAKNEPNLTMCDSCGRGPYNSYYYFLEHKRKFCQALRGKQSENDFIDDLNYPPEPLTTSPFIKNVRNTAKKTMGYEAETSPINEPFCLSPIIPRARKTMNSGPVSPQVSHDSSQRLEDNDNDNDLNGSPKTKQLIKCSLCWEDFDEVTKFIKHRLNHITQDIMQNEPSEQLKCELCDAKIIHYQRIQQHLILHLQNVQLTKKNNMVEVTKKWPNRYQSGDSDEQQNGTSFHCQHCNTEFQTSKELAQHIKNACAFRFQCLNCNINYSSKQSFLEHKEECSKKFPTESLKLPSFVCRNCGIEMKNKQKLVWHEHACNKVYAADHSAAVEEIVEKALSCSVCGLVHNDYDTKIKHESKCFKRYLNESNTNQLEDNDSEPEVVIKPLSVMGSELNDFSSSLSQNIPQTLLDNLRHEFGINKELKVILRPFDEEKVKKLKAELYSGERDEANQFESLKDSFIILVRRLIKDEEVLQAVNQESSAESLLSRMLKYLGEDPIEANGLNELSCFRQNLQTFLKLAIKDETLILAYKDAESVDEAIINMLNFECELH